MRSVSKRARSFSSTSSLAHVANPHSAISATSGGMFLAPVSVIDVTSDAHRRVDYCASISVNMPTALARSGENR
jgi:hypothetical protein